MVGLTGNTGDPRRGLRRQELQAQQRHGWPLQHSWEFNTSLSSINISVEGGSFAHFSHLLYPKMKAQMQVFQ